jgi:hypothetical protein
MHFRSNVDGSDANIAGFNADDYRSFSWASQFSARLVGRRGLSYAIVILLIGIAAGRRRYLHSCSVFLLSDLNASR